MLILNIGQSKHDRVAAPPELKTSKLAGCAVGPIRFDNIVWCLLGEAILRCDDIRHLTTFDGELHKVSITLDL